ncbi:hypothetical protein Taro_032129, partial [Colocasia esculenta]|nr:hypothetical protein [Colocasia esculenta]
MVSLPILLGFHFVVIYGLFALHNGDHDSVAPFVGTQEWIRSLNFSIVDYWWSWFVDGKGVGYTRSYSNNLTFATVKKYYLAVSHEMSYSYHTAPEYLPKECLAMLPRW